LGIIEQRIDDLIQMSNAASHHPLPREDFLRMAAAEAHKHHHHAGVSLRPPPTLPSLADADNDDDLFPTLGGGAFTTTNVNNNTLTNASAATANNNNNAPTTSTYNPSALGIAEDPSRVVQPINIALLKEYMAKKMSKQLAATTTTALTMSITKPGVSGGAATLDSLDSVNNSPSPLGRSKKPFGNSPVSFDA
jgi:hypothetical protein